jgi:Uma2 family endonuclease
LRPAKTTFTPAEYLAMEEPAEYKSEYYDGEIFAMAGGTANHSTIALSFGAELLQILKSKPCRVYNSDVRLLIQGSGLYTYPDLTIVCGKIEYMPRRKDTITNPILLVEILSESTRAYRGQKFNFYKPIPSLQEYVLVESEQPRVECYQRGDGDKWTVEMYDGLDAAMKLESVECETKSLWDSTATELLKVFSISLCVVGKLKAKTRRVFPFGSFHPTPSPL